VARIPVLVMMCFPVFFVCLVVSFSCLVWNFRRVHIHAVMIGLSPPAPETITAITTAFARPGARRGPAGMGV
jgi:nitrate reductase NapE component